MLINVLIFQQQFKNRTILSSPIDFIFTQRIFLHRMGKIVTSKVRKAVKIANL